MVPFKSQLGQFQINIMCLARSFSAETAVQNIAKHDVAELYGLSNK